MENTSDKLLSLRGGPGTSFAELVSMRAGTQLTITGKSKPWFRVKLNNGTTGFAHSGYVCLVEVPTVDPDRVTDNSIKIIGPDKADNNNSANQQQSSLNHGDIKSQIKSDQTDQKRIAETWGNTGTGN
ncbi:MAG: SH3 domain-containing protein [Hyphomicrobiales bacterium]|nr:SH3 domain-containing protein [Hyphomicrobiales bacterium]